MTNELDENLLGRWINLRTSINRVSEYILHNKWLDSVYSLSSGKRTLTYIKYQNPINIDLENKNNKELLSKELEYILLVTSLNGSEPENSDNIKKFNNYKRSCSRLFFISSV